MKRPYLLFCLGVLCLSWAFPPWVGGEGNDRGFGFLLDPPKTVWSYAGSSGPARIDLAKLLLLDMSIVACLAIAYGILSRPAARRTVLCSARVVLYSALVVGVGGVGVAAWKAAQREDAKERVERELEAERLYKANLQKQLSVEEFAEGLRKARDLDEHPEKELSAEEFKELAFGSTEEGFAAAREAAQQQKKGN